MDKEKTKSDLFILVNQYNDKVSSGEIDTYNEEMTKQHFILPLFKILGWDVYSELKGINEVTAEHRISRMRVDYAFRIDGIPKFFLEAKGANENLNERKFIDQAINYSWLKGVTWAVLTNFKQLKVFNAEVKATTLFTTQFLELDFDKFTDSDKLLLLTKESFENKQLDQEAEHVFKKIPRKPVGDRLFTDLMQARELLTISIKKFNKSSGLTKPLIEEIIQRIISRLIFIRTLEDREFIEIQLQPLIREKSRDSIQKRLNKIFRNLDNIYNSKLFEPHECEEVEIGNTTYKTIIQNLYESEEQIQKYNFDFLDADILGGIYEQYLGLLSKDTDTFRKKEGIYYTPKYISNFMVSSVIDFLKKQNVEIFDSTFLDLSCGSGSFLIKIFDNLCYEKLSNIQNEKHDVINLTYDEKLNIIQKNIFGIDLDPLATEMAQLNIFLKSAEKNQHLPILKDRIKNGNSLIEDKNFDSKSFVWVNEFAEIIENDGFTAIIGNPPYVSWDDIDRKERKFYDSGSYLDANYSCRPNHADAQPNYYLFFLVRAANLLSKNGVVSFIIPQEWLQHNKAQDFRDYLLKKFNEINIIQFNPDFKVFKSTHETIGTNSLILTLYKIGDKKITCHYIDSTDEETVQKCLLLKKYPTTIIKNFDELDGKSWKFTSGFKDSLKNKIESISDIVYLSDENKFNVKGGFQPPVKEAAFFEITNDEYSHLTDEEKEYVFPLIYKANEIKPYVLDLSESKFWIVCNSITSEDTLKQKFPNLFNILSKSIPQSSDRWWHFPNVRNLQLITDSQIKLLSPRTASQPSFALDEMKSVFKGTNTMIISKTIPTLYVLGILNSKLSDYWYSNFGTEYHSGTSKKFEPEKVKMGCLPILFIKKKETDVIDLVNQIILSKKRLLELKKFKVDEVKLLENSISNIQSKLDSLIFEIYQLTDVEIKQILIET